LGVSESTHDGPAAAAPTAQQKATESVIDNLGVWALIAAAIAFLYMVWATVRILGLYVGGIPGVGA
jgi:hypothetical protein